MVYDVELRAIPLIAAMVLGACSAPAPHKTPRTAELKRHTVDSDGHPIAVWEKSPLEPRVAILLIHGRTWSGLPDFDLQVEDEDLSLMDGLVAAGIATYAIDLRGYGGTPRDATGWLTPKRSVTDVTRVLTWMSERHGVKPFLFGWSLGSMVAQLTVQENPQLVAGLVLFGYPFDSTRPMNTTPRPDAPPRKPNTARNAASDFITPGTISHAAIDAYVEIALATDKVRVDWAEFGEFKALDPSLVTVPTLLIQAERDPYAPTAAQAQLFTGLATPDRVWITLPNCDHAALLESARPRFLRAIVDFVDRPRY